MWCDAIELLSSFVNLDIPGTFFPCHVMQCDAMQYIVTQVKNDDWVYVHYTNNRNLVKPPEVHTA